MAKRKRDEHEPPPPRKRSISDFNKLVTVVVGDGIRKIHSYKVHHDLVAHLPYFKPTRTSDDHQIKMPDFQPYTFQVYLQWLYNQEQRLAEEAWRLRCNYICGDQDVPDSSDKTMCLMRLWDLGQELGDTQFRNVCLYALLEEKVSTADDLNQFTIEKSLSRVDKDSSLRRWLVDTLSQVLTAGDADEWAESWPADFSIDILKKVLEEKHSGTKGRVPTIEDFEKYREPDDNSRSD